MIPWIPNEIDGDLYSIITSEVMNPLEWWYSESLRSKSSKEWEEMKYDLKEMIMELRNDQGPPTHEVRAGSVTSRSRY